MFTLLKLLQSLVKTLHSDGTPGQIAAGIAIGAALGLTPLLSLHNVFIVAALALLNVSFAAGLLGLMLFAPIGFLLDPLFDRIGSVLLLQTEPLRPLWEFTDGTPVVAWFNFNNTVLLGSIVGWLVLFIPIYFAARLGVLHYRSTLGARIANTKFYKGVRASRAYNVYRWFHG